MKADVKVYTLYAHDGASRAVFVTQVEIRCPLCGDEPLRYLIPGHHLRTLRDVLIDVIDQYPEEAGPDAGPQLKTADRTTFEAVVDPTKAGMN